VLIGFSQSFFLLYNDLHMAQEPGFESFWDMLLYLMMWMLGGLPDITIFAASKNRDLASGLFVLFMLLTAILLLNLLIAVS
jgi:hypothetical protein